MIACEQPGEPVAALPMYDWPEQRPHVDALWEVLRAGFATMGIDAPAHLDRAHDDVDVWRDPALLLSQTCGLPLALHLMDEVTVLGTFDSGLEGCPDGHYCSRLVARVDDERRALADFAGSIAAVSGIESWSGHGAFVAALPGVHALREFFDDALLTGAHRASVRAVAKGIADVAAIDAVSWALAQRHEAAAQHLHVVCSSPPMPALPLITRRHAQANEVRNVLDGVLTNLPESLRKPLLINGFSPATNADYAQFVLPDWG